MQRCEDLMPELPDLEVIKDFLQETIGGVQIQEVEIPEPLVLRCSVDDLINGLKGKVFAEIRRRGKFLILDVADGAHLVFHPMLAGRLQYCQAREKIRAGLCLRLLFSTGQELRYHDRKRMGRIYWLEGADFSAIPQFAELGPEANDPAVDLEVFQKRIRRHPGMVKYILTNQRFLAGIGNAYADEILFAAGILPFRKRPSLTSQELSSLHQAVGDVLTWAQRELGERMGSEIHVELRDFLKVHGKGSRACPVCGGNISEVAPNRSRTNFCRGCQR
jgi:formamidopyrimidine-DNA glycosylase